MIIQEIEASKGWKTWKMDHLKVRELNDRLMMAERAFTDRDGLLGIPWYKHLVSLFFSSGIFLPLKAFHKHTLKRKRKIYCVVVGCLLQQQVGCLLEVLSWFVGGGFGVDAGVCMWCVICIFPRQFSWVGAFVYGWFLKGFLFKPVFIWQPISPWMYFFSLSTRAY